MAGRYILQARQFLGCGQNIIFNIDRGTHLITP
jgi:hypothetical protein